MDNLISAKFVLENNRSMLLVGAIGRKGKAFETLKYLLGWCSKKEIGILVIYLNGKNIEIWTNAIKSTETTVDIWAVCMRDSGAITLTKGSGGKLKNIKVIEFGRSGEPFVDHVRSSLGMESHFMERRRGTGLVFSITAEGATGFAKELEEFLNKSFEKSRHISGLGGCAGGLSLVPVTGLPKRAAGRYRAVCNILEDLLGTVPGSVLVGVAAYWERKLTEEVLDVAAALAGIETVRLNGVLEAVVKSIAEGKGDEAVSNGDGESDGDGDEVAEDGGKGKGLVRDEDNTGGMERTTTRAMARMRIERSGAGAEFMELEDAESGSGRDGSEEDDEDEEDGEDEEQNDVPCLYLLKYDGFALGFPSIEMRKLVAGKVKRRALVVLGVRDLGVSELEVDEAWLGLEGAMVVDRSSGVLHFRRERRIFGYRGEKEFFADGEFVRWIVDTGCRLLGKGSGERKRWVSEVMEVQKRMRWPIVRLDDDWKMVVLGPGVAEEKVRR